MTEVGRALRGAVGCYADRQFAARGRRVGNPTVCAVMTGGRSSPRHQERTHGVTQGVLAPVLAASFVLGRTSLVPRAAFPKSVDL
jgi:hypothetical protein